MMLLGCRGARSVEAEPIVAGEANSRLAPAGEQSLLVLAAVPLLHACLDRVIHAGTVAM